MAYNRQLMRCPACGDTVIKRTLIPDSQGMEEIRARCMNCGHSWKEKPRYRRWPWRWFLK